MASMRLRVLGPPRVERDGRPIEIRLRRAVGLDTIDVESTESTDQNGETTQQTNAKVGKYITDKVYLEAERGVTDGTNKARVKVDLTPNLSVGSSVTDQAQTGVGIQWRYDY